MAFGLRSKIKGFRGSKKGLRYQLLRSGVGSIGIKLGHGMLAFFVSIILARTLGPEGFGNYSFVYALLMVLAIPAQSGLPQLVVRETAIAQARGEWSLMRGLWRWSTVVVYIVTLTLAVAMAIAVWIMGDRLSEQRILTLLVGLVLVPLLALGNLRGAALQGLRKVVLGQLANKVIIYVCLLFFLGAWAIFSSETLTPPRAMGLHVFAAVIAYIVGTILLRNARPAPLIEVQHSSYETRRWLKAVIPFALTAGFQLLNQYTDILMLGLFRNDAEVGIYQVVVTGASLVVFGLQAINMVVMPHFARIHTQGEHAQLQRLVTFSTRLTLLFALPTTFFYILWGDVLLKVIFGDTYAAGHPALSILCLGQLINAFTGSVGVLLNMTGNERETLRGVMIATGGNIFLNIMLIPPFGIAGAALATSCTLVIWNIILWRAVHCKLGIETMPFNLFNAKI